MTTARFVERCVCTPNREQLIANIVAQVAPYTFEQSWQLAASALARPLRNEVIECVKRTAVRAADEQRTIDARAQATIRWMEAHVRREDALEDEAYRRNVLYDAVHGRA